MIREVKQRRSQEAASLLLQEVIGVKKMNEEIAVLRRFALEMQQES